MNCEQAKDMFIEYLYGELESERMALLKAHLEACSGCTAELSSLAGVRGWVAGMPGPEPSKMAINRILAHAREEAEKTGSGVGFGWLKVFVPICFMIVVGGLIVYQQRGAQLPKQSGLSKARTQYQEDFSEQHIDLAPSAPSEEVITGELPAPELGAPSGDEQRRFKARAQPGKEEEEIRLQYSEELEGLASDQVAEREESGLADKEAVSLRDAPQKAEPSLGEIRSKEGKAFTSDSEIFKQADKAMQTGNYEQAREFFEDILRRLEPGDLERSYALFGLARAYEGLGELVKAKQLYQTLMDESPVYKDLARRKLEELAKQGVE